MGFMTIPRYPGKYPFRFGVLVVYVQGSSHTEPQVALDV